MSANRIRSTLFVGGLAAVVVALVVGMHFAPMTQATFTCAFLLSGVSASCYWFSGESESGEVVLASTAFAGSAYLLGQILGSNIPVEMVWYTLSLVAVFVGASLYCIKCLQWLSTLKVREVPTRRPPAKVVHR
jgi:hypothetical protein